MALDDNDKSWIKDTIIEALETVVLPRFDEHDKRFDVLEADVAELKDDVRVLKDDVRVLKDDVRVLKDDVRVLKDDVRVLKDDMRQVKTSLESLEGRVQALEADIKEIYLMQSQMEHASIGDKKFAKLTLEQKLLKLNSALLATAKDAGITLPR